jgi:hypothetical protein
MKKIIFILSILLFSVENSFAANKVTCPEKVLSTDILTGEYMGWFEAEEGFNTIGIKIDKHEEPVYIVASEEDADKFFGKGMGQQVSVTYNVEQFWIEEGQECMRVETFKSGKILSQQKNTKTK